MDTDEANERLTVGSSVQLKGELKPSRGKGQGWELVVSESRVLGDCDPAVSSVSPRDTRRL